MSWDEMGTYHPISVQGDANLSAVLLLKFIAEDLDDGAVGNEERMAYDPRLCAGITFGVPLAVGCATWCMKPFAVT